MKHIAILVLNDYEMDSRVKKEAASLSKHYDITIFALNNGHFPAEETKKGIQIIRKVSYKKPVNHFLKKLAQARVYMQYFSATLFRLKTFDMVHCNDLETLPFGVIAKWLNPHLKIIYDAHEYETQTHWLRGAKKQMTKILERVLIRYADVVITVSDGIADEYVRLYGIKKPALVLNTPSYQEIVKKDIFRKVFGIRPDQTIFLYQGGLSGGRGIEVLLEAFETLSNPNHVIVFMGYGPLQGMIEQKASQCNTIFYHPAVSPEVLLDYTSSADVGILFYENNCLNHYYCSPNKMFEYLMAELPVIVSNLYEMKKMVETNHIGVVAEENSPQGLQKAIIEVSMMDRDELQKNIRHIKEHYNWEQQEKVLLQLYSELSESK